jgi:hypothetical protein
LSASSYYATTIEQRGRSRLRLSTGLLTALDWGSASQEFEIYGFFRQPGELLCAPIEIAEADAEHPFESLVRRVKEIRAPPRFPQLAAIPPATELILPTRLERYTASWDKARDQLDLNLGEEVLRTLRADNLIHAIAYGGVLNLMSPSAYAAARSKNIEFLRR